MKNLHKIIAVLSVLLCGFCLFCACGETPPATFNISGYVLEDGKGVEGVLLSSEAGNVTTDENGYFCFNQISTGITIEANKDGYVFENSTQTFFSATENANFTAYRYYTISGKVKSEDVGVNSVMVYASAIKGGYTVTNENGEFVIYNVAGPATLTAEKNGFLFFDVNCDYTNCNNIEINATTSANLNIDYVGLSNDFINETQIEIDGNAESFGQTNAVLKNLKLGSKIKLINNNLKFIPGEFTIEKENENLLVRAYKIYSIDGCVKSGDYPIQNATIKVLDKETLTNENGEFALDNLYGDNEIEISHTDFYFDKISCDENNTKLNIIGYTEVCGNILTKNKPLENVLVSYGKNNVISSADGEFNLNKIILGETIAFSLEGYKFMPDKVIVSEPNQNFIVDAYKFYDATIKFIDDDGELLKNTEIFVNSNSYVTDDLGQIKLINLFDDYCCEFILNGYYCNSITLNESQLIYTVKMEKVYSFSAVIKTGEIILKNKNITINDKQFTTNQDGIIAINNLHGTQIFSILCEGYNPLNIEANYNNNNQQINLTYNVSGYVYSQNIVMPNVEVSYNENSTFTNSQGFFEIFNLQGTNTLSCNHDCITTTSSVVVNENTQNVVINVKYKVFGYAISEETPLANTKIFVTNYQTNISQQILTNNLGYFEFIDIEGKNILFYENEDGLKLRPTSYDVTFGGQYDFVLNGFELGGFVMSNGNPVSGVTITAGEQTVTTNEKGYYYFNLLKNDCELLAFKQGYTFLPASIFVTSDDNERKDINFEASYFVEGYVTWGNTKLNNVDIRVGEIITQTNENGYFKINNLSGENFLYLNKTGFQFEDATLISGYDNLTINAGKIIQGTIKSGSLFVSNVLVCVGDEEYLTNSQGEFSFVLYNDEANILCSKEGYAFDLKNFDINSFENQIISASYTISGTIKSNDVLLDNVKIILGEEEYFTNNLGQFQISNIEGEKSLSFEKDGYKFSSYNVIAPQNYDVNASYRIYGYVSFNGVKMQGVMVSTQSQSILTDENGFYSFDNLVGSGTLLIEKRGYSFRGGLNYNISKQIDFEAMFTICGYVNSNEIALGDVIVRCGDNETITNESGYFELNNLDANSQVEFIKSGYNSVSKTYSDFAENENINLTYNISINFSGITEYSNIILTVQQNGIENQIHTISSSNYILKNVSGQVYLSFEKDGFVFNPQIIGVKSPSAISIAIQKSYKISGRVTVEGSNVPVIGMKITAGNNYVYTNSNGDFVLSGLVGTNIIKGTLSYLNCESLETSSVQVVDETLHNFVIPSVDYTYFVFQKGYQLLREANSSYVNIVGTVNLTMGGTQQVRGIRKTDSNGITLTEKLNYGEKVAGVDPRVSLLTYYNNNTGETKYQQVKDVNSNYEATYGNFTDTTPENYKSIYGLYPYDHFAYTINKSTIKSINGLAKNGTNTIFTFVLNPSTAVSNYIKQMSALSGQTPSKFNYCNLTYTIDENGFIRTLQISEQYEINVVVTVTGTSEITETYMVYDKDTTLTDIDINDIKISLKFEIKNQQQTLYCLPNKLKGEDNE